MTTTARITEYDEVPKTYRFDTTAEEDLQTALRVYRHIGDLNFDFGRYKIPEIRVESYEEAARARQYLDMTECAKYQCEYNIYYTGISGDGDQVIIALPRGRVCTIEYIKEEITEMVVDPEYVAPEPPMIEHTKTVTRSVYNCDPEDA